MTQLEHQERFSKGTKLALALLVNLLIPALGNLLLIGRTTGNFICLLVCIFAWSGKDWRVVLAWSLFMDFRAFVDIYIMPAHIARTRSKEMHSNRKNGDAQASALRAVSSPLNETAAHPHHQPGDDGSIYYPGDDMPHPVSAGQHGDHPHSVNEPGHPHGTSRPYNAVQGVADHDLSHGTPLPLNAAQGAGDQAHSHGAHSPLNAVHGTEEPAHSHGIPLPLNAVPGTGEHGHSHGAFLPFNAAHGTEEPGHSHGTPLPLNAAHGTEEHAHSHGTPLPLNAAHGTEEHAHSHGAPLPLNAAPGTGAHEHVQGTGSHGAPLPLKPVEHSIVGSAAAISAHTNDSGSHGHIINQHKVIDSLLHAEQPESAVSEEHSLKNPHDVVESLMHPQEPASLSSHGHDSKLAHPEEPLAGIVEKNLDHKESVSENEGGVMFDIYGDEEEDAQESALSPFEDGIFHTLGAINEEQVPGALPCPASFEPAAGADSHQHHLMQVNYGEPNSTERVDSGSQAHKKHVQLCPTCQQPREHNRPTCPACGTHYEAGFV